MPVTFMVLIVICDIAMLGSAGEVASTVIIPMNPEHWARPFASMLTPVGAGWVENGFPSDHLTGKFADIGDMLKVPIAVNCTIPLEFFASAEAGDMTMLCNCRLDISMERPPQETISNEIAIRSEPRNTERWEMKES